MKRALVLLWINWFGICDAQAYQQAKEEAKIGLESSKLDENFLRLGPIISRIQATAVSQRSSITPPIEGYKFFEDVSAQYNGDFIALGLKK